MTSFLSFLNLNNHETTDQEQEGEDEEEKRDSYVNNIDKTSPQSKYNHHHSYTPYQS